MTIEALYVWPGMLIKGYEEHGRIFDGTYSGRDNIRFQFYDGYEITIDQHTNLEIME